MHPESTLLDRVLKVLRIAPSTSTMLCHEVVGLPGAPAAVCDRVAIALLGADPRVRQLHDGRWGLVPEAQGSPMLEDCAFAVVDVETTGMRAYGTDRITEIAVVVVPTRSKVLNHAPAARIIARTWERVSASVSRATSGEWVRAARTSSPHTSASTAMARRISVTGSRSWTTAMRPSSLALSPGHNEAVTALAPSYYRTAVPT